MFPISPTGSVNIYGTVIHLAEATRNNCHLYIWTFIFGKELKMKIVVLPLKISQAKVNVEYILFKSSNEISSLGVNPQDAFSGNYEKFEEETTSYNNLLKALKRNGKIENGQQSSHL